MSQSIILNPPPVFFIKSISEQGYSLSTAVADLIDNSIAAGATRVEVLINSNQVPLRLFIADNGGGMDATALTENMRFPSADLDATRNPSDLGRFGLGLKTASFSQSRKFTVLSRTSGAPFEGRTWDVEHLKKTDNWTLIIETADAAESLKSDYIQTSKSFHAHSPDFRVNTLVVWNNLYKLERLPGINEIAGELEELKSHLGLVFHRYIQSKRLELRLNNSIIEGFEPFPSKVTGVQIVADSYWRTVESYIQFQGIILPKRAAAESKDPGSIWIPAQRTLEEMQGFYVYRNDRLISWGGWMRTIPKSAFLQFGRIKIDITNINDSDFHLNVAKSSLKIPFGLKRAMNEMIQDVAARASNEYRERTASNVIRPRETRGGLSLIVKEMRGKGPYLRINEDFEIFRRLSNQLNPEQRDLLGSFTGLIERKLNEIWNEDSPSGQASSAISEDERQKIHRIMRYYQDADYSWEEIMSLLLDSFGRRKEIELFIESIKEQ
ncbi:MAG: hypothetical protein BGO21_26295 [Dyadobacter sp. 50-39]|uniref:ATP-binding protein n=1 Tax=Dyadobacter sp. 50-39 TaxID=1895756 RepID=UPI000968C3F3|nr:ATP-binding protein [Dyadobacter sp. 50-39]OJV16410.1 MAG: hypothetical protein BGO21_26295 [Dyadobacter sp. 50-39]